MIDKIIFNNNEYFVKRDDLLKPFDGNKARKLAYFLKNDLPIKRIISYGSNQSNAMYALAKLAKIKNWEFHYYTNHISKFLLNNPHGNYYYALKEGMKIYQINLNNEQLKEYVYSLKDEDTFIIEEGARIKESEYGIKELANEIEDFVKKNNLSIFLPSGTGTTAFYLAKNLDVEVITTPCVGDIEYLKKQMQTLGKIPKNLTIIQYRKYHFAKPYLHLYQIWKSLKKDIEFDLIYDPIGWEVIMKKNLKNILYIHQGGLKGNESMLLRYKHKFKQIN